MLINHSDSFPSNLDKTNDDLLKNFPFSYYNSQLFSDLQPSQENLSKKFDSLSLDSELKESSEVNLESERQMNLKEKLESDIKNKYNLIIPAILIEVQENGRNSIQFQKEDLKNLLTSLGRVKHIEINQSIAYVLYEHYFSALLAYNVMKELVSREKKNIITIKLFTKEEDEEKQKKVYNQSKRKKGGLVGLNSSGKKTPGSDKKNSYKLRKESEPYKPVKSNSSVSNSSNLQQSSQLSKISEIPEVSESFFTMNSTILYENPNNPNNLPHPSDNSGNISNNPLFLPFNINFGPLPAYQFPSYPYPSNFPHNNPNQPGNQSYLLKFVCNYDIQIENDSKFRVTKRLIGNKGLTLKKILFDCCVKFNDFTTKIRLRGRGSGYKEGVKNEESPDPLQLCVSSLNYFTYSKCCEEVEKFLNQIYYEYFNFLFSNNLLMEATPKKIVKYEYVVNRY